MVRARRLAAGLTLVRLAEKAQVDVSQLSKMERGEVGLGGAALERVARPLGLTLPELYARAFDLRRVKGAWETRA